MILKMREDNGNPNVALRLQPFASPEKLHDVVSATYRNLKTRKPVVQKSMSLYLANKDTEYILFKPIKVRTSLSVEGMKFLFVYLRKSI